MKFFHLWPVALSLCSAIVIPDEQVLGNIAKIDTHHRDSNSQRESPSFFGSIHDVAIDFRNALDEALDSASDAASDAFNTERLQTSAFEASSWITNFFKYPIDAENLPKDLRQLPQYLHPRRPLPPHHPSFNKTIYELIKSSKYTTILAKIIDEDDELVQFLNSTKANHTVFAPTDKAFAKIPHHHCRHDHDHDHDHDDDNDDDDHKHHKIPKEVIGRAFRYHTAPGRYSASDIFHSHTIPTILNESTLGPDLPQRLAVRVGWKGLKLNFYSRIIAADIGATNGIIHGIDAILLPPPETLTLLTIIPSEFSTFTLALHKTGLAATLNGTATPHHHGGTIFAPSNSAFHRLGFKLNAFLFSPHGERYLRALLQYHIVANRTLYSDVFYTADGKIEPFGVKGFTHIDLPTRLHGRKLAVDLARFGPYASLKINGFQRVAFADALAKDGTVHVVDHVLIPPRKVDGSAPNWTGHDDELTVEDLKSRLGDWLDEEQEQQQEKQRDTVGVLDDMLGHTFEL
ncbi:fasciclin domain-containing protein [Aspergillus clavatus NRRL 1]|uniref:Fasciclin domain family n=1 Tax=Aspergillus clavatus (strain ATCC 1007 / CBS 513.65 / DSM 816 / NCTC 3887 / NRRL 1 / QM 1276 / 107) TaxID=344612 RepID=A1CP32_ASPCL|nr:Fasciclin domain family [Aspergillus clavatus NRRL 1]EAW07403.1 Fasciclin domain family [Aspergillus clavatus NRRL 1]